MKLHLQLRSIGGQRSGVKKALSRVKSHLVDRPRSHFRVHCPSVGFRRPQSEATCSFVVEMKFGRRRSRHATLTRTTKERDGGHLKRLTRRPQIGKRFKMWNACGSKVRMCLVVVSDCHNLRAPVFLYVTLCYDMIYDTIWYLLTAIGFPPCGSGQ